MLLRVNRFRFMVSTDLPSYNSSLVRLIHGDENPAGPGFKEERLVSAIDGRQAGRKQHARTGSYVVVANHSLLSQLTSFTLQAWIWPTTPLNGEEQGLLSKWSADEVGMCLAIGKQGALELWLGGRRRRYPHQYGPRYAGSRMVFRRRRLRQRNGARAPRSGAGFQLALRPLVHFCRQGSSRPRCLQQQLPVAHGRLKP